ncbi:hypothetical protein SARC_01654 [Sphaeroforma arctica JP610]|uniref:Glycoside-hydrolase family GH114 TIM-barrel domain-containing protein n=1 Tax=Sphaeroforma arctica JP610 TaxID=667725 RepID=A0A0L0GBB0_9EUKA|nr:hypothetical protein SARC_01654 [Sphaeroforma arctica JP610]KNC86176.1 hypothetical protein SARC_01654 [Sphaeroforma arctica JP610]|eukprot:XP_014160078.1 hypothetical protein SARC_01654 [Sphaeroforma arctica JP610]
MVLISRWGLMVQVKPNYLPLFNELYIDPDDSRLTHHTKNDRNNIEVFCYVFVGSAEEWRDDYKDLVGFTDRVYPGWEDEWLSPKNEEIDDPVFDIMQKRFARDICSKGMRISYKNDISRYEDGRRAPNKGKDNLVVEVGKYLACPEFNSAVAGKFKTVHCVHYNNKAFKKNPTANIKHLVVSSGENWNLVDM